MNNMKLQSAMEYLMTYGWAILIIAVVMVALFSLGILGGSPLTTTCLPQSGYQCSGVVYSHTSGNVVATIGQTTGNNWASANVYFVPQGTSTTGAGVPSSISNNPKGGNVIGTLNSGATATSIDIPVSAPSTAAGTSTSGQLWAVYYVTSGGTTQGPYYSQLATVTLKAV